MDQVVERRQFCARLEAFAEAHAGHADRCGKFLDLPAPGDYAAHGGSVGPIFGGESSEPAC